MTLATLAGAFALRDALLAPAPASASLECALPAVFGIGVEERQMLDAGGAGLVVVRAEGSSVLRPGDAIRQANDRRTLHCADLEGAAAEAMAKGLVLLLAVERDERTIAVALPEPTSPAGGGVAAGAAAHAPAAGGAAAPAPPSAVAVAPAPSPTVTPLVRREAPLPPRADASSELVAKTLAAAAVLATIDDAAHTTVPIAMYQRRVDDAENAIAALRIEGAGAEAVQAVVAEVFDYHHTALDIRRYTARQLEQSHTDQRGAGALSQPYFSDSEVPRWVARFPFLSESIEQAPRTTHVLLPGEAAGRWNPDQALELLWEHAQQAEGRLSKWSAS